MRDWNDIRYFLAVAQKSILSGTAADLSVNHSTVFRLINQLGERVGARLLKRHGESYTLTAAGETMRGSAERVEAEMATLNRQVIGEDVRLTGTVRLTAPDDISERLLPERLAAFRETYPGIMLEMIVADRFLNLSRRDANVAFWPSRDPGDTLIGQRLCAVAVTIYRRRDALPAPLH